MLERAITEPLRLIKQRCPWEEGCDIKSPVWNYLLILHSSQPTGLCVCTRLKCALIWRGGSHLGLELGGVTDGRMPCFVSSEKKTSNALVRVIKKKKEKSFVAGNHPSGPIPDPWGHVQVSVSAGFLTFLGGLWPLKREKNSHSPQTCHATYPDIIGIISLKLT